MRRRALMLLASLPLVAGSLRFAPEPAVAADTRTSYTFQALFLLADNTGSGSLGDVPANAQKALQDASSFLPYKSYKLLDSAWIRTSFRGSARFTGPGGVSCELILNVDIAETSKERIVVHDLVVQPLTSDGTPKGRPLLTSTFSLAPGETVIVGTSRLDGPSNALVVLLTAIQ